MAPIVVRASPEQFAFTKGGLSLTVAPVVWFNPDGKIAAFGLAERFPPELTRLDIFPANRPYGFVPPLFTALQAFLLYHFEVISRPAGTRWWRHMARPRSSVVFEEIRGFEGSVPADAAELLLRAARAAGARRARLAFKPAPGDLSGGHRLTTR